LFGTVINWFVILVLSTVLAIKLCDYSIKKELIKDNLYYEKTLLNLVCFFLPLRISSFSQPYVDCSNCPEGTTLTDESGNEVASLEIYEDNTSSKV